MSTSDAGKGPPKPESEAATGRGHSPLLELGDALSAALAEAEKFANQAATQAAIARMVADQRGEAGSEGDAAAADHASEAPAPGQTGHDAPRVPATDSAASPPTSLPPMVQIGPNIRGMPTGDRPAGQGAPQQVQLDVLRQRANADAESAARAGRELEAAKADLKATRQRFARVAEQYEEAQRRCERMETELPSKASRKVLQTLLPAMDVQTAVVRGMLADEALSADHRRALQMSVAEWERALASIGVGAFDTEGQRFDPIVHEAIAHVPSAAQPAGTVVRQVGRGYLFEGRVLRPAQVVVAAAPEGE